MASIANVSYTYKINLKQGDASKLRLEFITRAPFIDFAIKGTNVSLDEMIEAYFEFAKALIEIIEGDTIVGLIERISRLPREAEELKDRTKPEFERLDAF